MNCRLVFLRPYTVFETAVLCCALAALAGCKSTPHHDKQKDDVAVDAKTDATKTATPAELAAILNEVQQMGVLDPQAQNALLEDLKRTDPALWPQLVQTFRASIAYRRQVAERAQRESELAQQSGRGNVKQAAYNDGHGDQVQPLPDANDAALLPPVPPASIAGMYPNTNMQAARLGATSAANGDWRSQLAATIQALESQSDGGADGQKPLSAADQATLRLLHLVAGQRDDALKPLTGVTNAEQEFWGEEIYGLATTLDEQRTPDASRRAAEAVQHLREAASKLGQTATMVLRNLAFCTEVSSYGVIKPFPKYEFKPGQEVVLYAELENFTSDSGEKGYHTALHSSYQIFDSRGMKVDDKDYAVTEEVCRNLRRDFFVRYFVYMPKLIYNGNYTLQLTIEDTNGKKIGQSSIQFAIAGAD